MKHRKALMGSIWAIALGVILWVSALFPYQLYELAWSHYLVVGLAWAGTITIILGIFGLTTTVLKEYLDRREEANA